ncbi:MAG: right-handed parallel beta-helix repeat-containing protein [Nocardioidaceae bacterium]
MYRKQCVPLALALTATAVALTGTPASARPTITVASGGSIQQALNRAPAGATVVVRAGHYRESLTITKSVSLTARRGVVLTPPATAPENACTQDPDAHGAMPGLCVVGTPADPTQEGSGIAKVVHNVHLSGFNVSGFPAGAVEVYGARHVTIAGLNAHGNHADAIFLSHSRYIHVSHLTARHNQGRGVAVQEQVSGFSITKSNIAANRGEGIFVGDSTHGTITDNHLTHNCVGILLVDLGVPGQQGASRIRVAHNTVDANNRLCPGGDAPSESGNGIILVGARHASVSHNKVRRNHGAHSVQVGFGGIAVLDAGHFTGGSAPIGNRIDHNVIRHNTPNLTYDHSGHGNTFAHNRVGG